ncbi:nuclear transport factor 2 family protein [Reyranella sp.]|uniref:YybH family protein n=1 Tax=Reyranella sp. TaxID=1929291 RepID=UPI0025D0F843|nr:nuclear transport factor 2 family protein [Reyranella sp.]
MSQRWLAVIVALAAVVGATAAFADPAADRAAIIQRFERWTAAFNAKDAAGSCDLFAPDLVYSFPGMLRGTRETICTNFEKLFARTDLQARYGKPDIHEIIVAGDVAIVRLTWTLTTEANGAKDTTTEEGMDFFQRQPDGKWSIARYIAFAPRPNKLLQ